MRFFKIFVYLLAVLVLQTVVFARLNFWGAMPDLVLVSVIIYAVLEDRTSATIFSAVFAFLQDLFSAGIYINVITKVVVSSVISLIREEFIGNDFSLAVGLVVVFSPLIILIDGLVRCFFLGQHFGLFYFAFRMAAATAYNFAAVYLLFPFMKRVTGGN